MTMSDILSFTITGPAGTMDTAGATFAALEFIIGPSQLPTLWTMAVEQQLTAGTEVEEYITTFGPTSVFGAFQEDSYTRDDPVQNSQTTRVAISSYSISLPGSWTVVPEPTTFTLAAMSLLGLGFAAWRKKIRRA